MLIDRFMPSFELSERHRTEVWAEPASAYAAVRRLDLGRSPLVRLLFGLRGLPRLLAAGSSAPTATLDDFVRAASSCSARSPARRSCSGWWAGSGRRAVAWCESSPRSSRPSAGQAMPRRPGASGSTLAGPGRSVVSTETRVEAGDEGARRRLRRYWRVVRPWSGLVRRRALALVKGEAEAERRSSG